METAGCEQDYPRWLTDEFREVNAAGEKIPRSTAARGERLARIPATARPSLRQAALESLRWHKKRARSAPCPFIAPGLRARLSAGARQGMHPALHAAFGVLNVLVAEPFFQIDSVDRINRTHEVALVAERHGGVDAHAAFEVGVRSGPLALAG